MWGRAAARVALDASSIFYIPGPVLTAGTGAPDGMRGDSRKPHPSKWRSEEPGMEEDPDLGSGQKLKAN